MVSYSFFNKCMAQPMCAPTLARRGIDLMDQWFSLLIGYVYCAFLIAVDQKQYVIGYSLLPQRKHLLARLISWQSWRWHHLIQPRWQTLEINGLSGSHAQSLLCAGTDWCQHVFPNWCSWSVEQNVWCHQFAGKILVCCPSPCHLHSQLPGSWIHPLHTIWSLVWYLTYLSPPCVFGVRVYVPQKGLKQ